MGAAWLDVWGALSFWHCSYIFVVTMLSIAAQASARTVASRPLTFVSWWPTSPVGIASFMHTMRVYMYWIALFAKHVLLQLGSVFQPCVRDGGGRSGGSSMILLFHLSWVASGSPSIGWLGNLYRLSYLLPNQAWLSLARGLKRTSACPGSGDFSVLAPTRFLTVFLHTRREFRLLYLKGTGSSDSLEVVHLALGARGGFTVLVHGKFVSARGVL
eukprot:g49672.t1